MNPIIVITIYISLCLINNNNSCYGADTTKEDDDVEFDVVFHQPTLGSPNAPREPLPGALYGSADALVRTYEDVFSEELLEQLIKEAPELDKVGRSRLLSNNKRQTFWMPMGVGAPKPRFGIEHAVNLLFDLLYANSYESESNIKMRERRKQIVGGKYWVQYRPSNEDVSFHYDKDEGLASDHMIMRFPQFATVTYLSNAGAPTIIFNQTVTQNGNVEVPQTPTNTFIVYPKKNKHMINRGDLNHGALQKLSANPLKEDEIRITFVVSWETKKPLEPNCHYLTDDEINEFTSKLLLNNKNNNGSGGMKMNEKWTLSKNIKRGEILDIKANKHDQDVIIPMGRPEHFLKGKWPDPTTRFKVKDGTYNLIWEDENDVEMF